MKRFWAVFLVLCAVMVGIGGMGNPAKAAETIVDGIMYSYNTVTETATVIRNGSGYSGNITIPKTVSIGETYYSVTGIGDYAFQGCSNLNSISIPASVTSIGNDAFYSCIELGSISIPAGVTSIGSYAFFDCSGLGNVTFSASSKLTSIGEGAFFSCTSLGSISIPDSVTSIGDYAFQDCGGLTSIEIPASVTSIGKYAFFATSISSVTVYSSILTTSSSSFPFIYLNNITFNQNQPVSGEAPHGKTSFTMSPGGLVTVNAAPNTGYQLDSLTCSVDNSNIALTKVKDDEYTFYAPDGGASLTINATFTYSAGLNITTQPTGRSWTYGAAGDDSARTLSVAATAADGHALSYEWYSSETGEKGTYIPVSGAKSASYVISRDEPAGTKYYYCKVTATRTGESDAETANSEVATVTVDPLTQTITADNVEAIYGDTGKSVVASTDGGGKISYAVKDGSGEYIDVDASSGALTIKKAGEAIVVVTAEETKAYAKATKEVTVYISRADCTPAAVTANNRTFDGTEKPLVTVDDSKQEGCTMYYALGSDAASAPADGWETAIPAGKEAKTYYVWYKAVGDGNHTDTDPKCVEVTISKNSDQIAAEKVTDLIGKLPAVADVTLSDQDAIEAARAAYDALTDEGKKYVTNLDKLTDAEKAWKAVKDAADQATADQAAADAVTEKINALPKAEDVKLSDQDAIEAARKAYDALTEDQKKLVSAETLKKLTDAEAAYKAAKGEEAAEKAAAEKAKADAAVAKKVIEQIEALPKATDVKLSDQDAIEAARKAYDALTEDQKKLVSAETLKKLTDAEARYKALKEEAEKPPVYPVWPVSPIDPGPQQPEQVTVGGMVYRLNHEKKTATVLGTANRKAKTVFIPSTIQIPSLNGEVLANGGAKYKVTEIAAKAFQDMEKLKQVTIGKNVTTIGAKAFYKCGRLKTLVIRTKHLTAETVGANAFGKTAKNMKVTCPKGRKKLYEEILRKKGISKKAKFK